jgi:hypothetical protein
MKARTKTSIGRLIWPLNSQLLVSFNGGNGKGPEASLTALRAGMWSAWRSPRMDRFPWVWPLPLGRG